MSFYICLALAVIVTISGIIYYRRNKDAVGMPESPFRVLLLIALADTCILYIPWFIHLWYADSIYRGREIFFLPFMIVRLMQTVSLDADYEAALEMVGFARSSGVSVFFLEAYAVLLSYVSVLVPLSGILTIMTSSAIASVSGSPRAGCREGGMSIFSTAWARGTWSLLPASAEEQVMPKETPPFSTAMCAKNPAPK